MVFAKRKLFVLIGGLSELAFDLIEDSFCRSAAAMLLRSVPCECAGDRCELSAALCRRLEDPVYRFEIEEICRSGVVGRSCNVFRFVDDADLNLLCSVDRNGFVCAVVGCALDIVVLDANGVCVGVDCALKVLHALNQAICFCEGEPKAVCELGFYEILKRFVKRHGPENLDVFKEVKEVIEKNESFETKCVFKILSRYLKCILKIRGKSQIELEYVALVQIVAMEMEIPRNYAQKMMERVLPFVEHLNISALSMASQLMKFISRSDAITVLETMPAFVISSLLRISPAFELPSLEESKAVVELPVYNHPEVNINLRFTDSMPCTLNLNPDIKFPERASYDSLISLEWKSIIGLLILPARRDHEYASVLLHSLSVIKIQDIPQQFQAVFSVTLIYICYLLHSAVTPEVLSNLLAPPIFDPRVTVYDNCDHFEVFDILRNAVVNVVLLSQGRCFPVIVMNCVRYPVLFAEILSRFLNKDLKSVNFMSDAFQSLMKALLYYEQQTAETMSLRDREAIAMAKSSICCLISRLLREDKGPNVFLSKVLPISSLLSLCTDDSLKQWIFGELSYMLTYVNEIPADVIESIEHFLSIVSFCLLNTEQGNLVKHLVLVTSVVKCINDGLSQNGALGRPVRCIGSVLVNMIPKLPASEEG